MKNAIPGMASNPEVGNPAHDHDLLTVDVWDTLLRRRCHPDSVKLHVGRYLALNYAAHLPPGSRDAWTLLRLRQQAEKDLADWSQTQGLDDEYRHMAVYRRWLTLAGLDPFPLGEAALERLLLTLEQIELAQEKYVSYADPTISSTLGRQTAKRSFFLSDFYLPASAIRELLDHHGIAHLAPDGMVSCDVGLNKRSGRLYNYLHEQLGVLPDRHLHVGDNPLADVKAARAAGVTAIHYLPPEEHGRRQHREATFHARTDALRTAVRDLLASEPSQTQEHRKIYDYGRACSLLLVGFVAYVMERAVADGVDRLYFFTREGEFFQEIYRRLASRDVLGFPPPPAELLQVSRIATFAGSLRGFSTAELMRLWNQYSVQSLSALFKSLAMNPAAFADRAAAHGLDMAQPVRYPWQDERVIAFLGDEKVRVAIERELSGKRANLLAYLASAGLTDRLEKVGIVDIGWRGTIQDNLAYALPQVEWHGYYLALNRYLNLQPANVRKHAFGPNLNESEDHSHLLDFVAPVEMLCNSPNGSVDGYRITDHGIWVFRHVNDEENRIHDAFVRHFQSGVLDALPYWADFLRTHAYSANELRPVAMDIWSGIIQQPPPFLAQAYFRLSHNETFGVGGFSDKRRMLAAGDVLRACVSRKYRARLHEFLIANGWVPGLLVCPDVDPAFRRVLRWFLRALKVRNRFRRPPVWLR